MLSIKWGIECVLANIFIKYYLKQFVEESWAILIYNKSPPFTSALLFLFRTSYLFAYSLIYNTFNLWENGDCVIYFNFTYSASLIIPMPVLLKVQNGFYGKYIYC